MRTTKLNISEHFYTVQGEGVLTGVPSYFIRLQGCDLSCWWCDTAYASYAPEKGLGMIPIEQLVDEAFATNTVTIAFTGGEPTIQREALVEICKLIRARAKAENRFIQITVETHGNHYIEDLDIDLISMSPKLKSSSFVPEGTPIPKGWKVEMGDRHEAKRLNLGHIHKWLYYAFSQNKQIQLKFVVCNESDLKEIDNICSTLKGIPVATNVGDQRAFQSFINRSFMLMPEGLTPEALNKNMLMLVEACKFRGWRLSDRLHVRIWDKAIRGV